MYRNRKNQSITQDYLSRLNDDSLRRLYLDTRSYINKGRRKKFNTKDAEVDLCYIQFEIQNRTESKKKMKK